jgi:hypothetical protein
VSGRPAPPSAASTGAVQLLAPTTSRSHDCSTRSPDRDDYLALKERGLSHPRASLTLSRKLARRCFHTLRALGSEALEPVT